MRRLCRHIKGKDDGGDEMNDKTLCDTISEYIAFYDIGRYTLVYDDEVEPQMVTVTMEETV